jgi:hypothetical protein
MGTLRSARSSTVLPEALRVERVGRVVMAGLIVAWWPALLPEMLYVFPIRVRLSGYHYERRTFHFFSKKMEICMKLKLMAQKS